MSKPGIIKQQEIESRIFTIRDSQVMVDRDLAEMYCVETKRLNEQVRRNVERFPISFRFQLTNIEKDELVANCDRFENLKHSSSLPYVFTEQGVAMLSAVLRSKVAIQVSIQIMSAFAEMRKFLINNVGIFLRLENIEKRQFLFQSDTEKKFELIFNALQNNNSDPLQGIFFDGQVFDAYKLIADIIRKAKTSIVLIDNYVDDTVLSLFIKRKKGVSLIIYTKTISRQLALDLDKHNSQYESIIIKEFKDAHDRFLILDNKTVYHIGASLKDLGKKWFAFSKMETTALNMLNRLNEKSRE